ncbi:MAG: acetate/propionate family kinase [Burkholderiaceae bacterium]|jgi:acetate kinase|nr:acetate/propionate family kinase [Burkholderiaceae bacterium]
MFSMPIPTQRYFAVINAGSSSYKFSLFAEMDDARLERHTFGEIEGVGRDDPFFLARDSDRRIVSQHSWGTRMTSQALLEFLVDWIEVHLSPNRLNAVGHRVVHGGPDFVEPVLLTPDTLERLRRLTPLTPLHHPRVLGVMDVLTARYPDLCQIACFDTSFHQTNPYLSRLYGLPGHLTEKGLVRYGFHGLSYEYVIGELQQIDPVAARGRTIIAHLGSGASLCGLIDGKSIASTMGFSTLDGLVMGTRTGALDPGVILYLLRYENMSVEELETMLYKESGLLGVSGISADMRDLLTTGNPASRTALDLFVYRVIRETGSLMAAIGGVDNLVFTAGIGERSPEIRAAICKGLDWLGIRIDEDANQHGHLSIHAPDSKIPVWIIPTFEELMIARHGARLSAAFEAAKRAQATEPPPAETIAGEQ